MGNCSNCKFCTEQDNDSIDSSLQFSSHSILGEYSKITPTNTICCCKTKSIRNQNLINNIKLSPKEKKMFEKKISKNTTNTNTKTTNIIVRKTDGILSSKYNQIFRHHSDKLDLSDISLSVSNKLFINEIEQSPEKKYKILKNIGNGSYGDVFLAYNIYTKEKVAIKKIYKSNEQLLSDGIILDEIEIL